LHRNTGKVGPPPGTMVTVSKPEIPKSFKPGESSKWTTYLVLAYTVKLICSTNKRLDSWDERDCFVELRPVIKEIEQGLKIEQEPVAEALLVIKETEDGLALTMKKVRSLTSRRRSS